MSYKDNYKAYCLMEKLRCALKVYDFSDDVKKKEQYVNIKKVQKSHRDLIVKIFTKTVSIRISPFQYHYQHRQIVLYKVGNNINHIQYTVSIYRVLQ